MYIYCYKNNSALAYFSSIGLAPPSSPTPSSAASGGGGGPRTNPADFLLSLLAPVEESSPPPSESELPLFGGGHADGDDGDSSSVCSSSSRSNSMSVNGVGGVRLNVAVTPAELARAYLDSRVSAGVREGVEREAVEANARRFEKGSGVRDGDGGRKTSTLWLSTVLTHRQVGYDHDDDLYTMRPFCPPPKKKIK